MVESGTLTLPLYFWMPQTGPVGFALDMLLPECPNQPRSARMVPNQQDPRITRIDIPPELPESWLRPNCPNWIAARIGSCGAPESPNQNFDKLDVFPNPRIGNPRLQDNSKYCLCCRSLTSCWTLRGDDFSMLFWAVVVAARLASCQASQDQSISFVRSGLGLDWACPG